jgi:hypothetical protein
VRHLAALDQRLNITSHALERMQHSLSEEDDPDPMDSMVVGKGTLHTTIGSWTGNTTGASSAAHRLASPQAGMERNMNQGRAGFQGDGGLGGTRGSVLRGIGGGGGSCGCGDF